MELARCNNRGSLPRRTRRKHFLHLAVEQGDGIVEVFAWETESGFALHLLNYTNPNMLSGWFTETYPVANDSARLLL